MSNLVGTTLGQYQIVELIGEGGMAHVYKAWQPSLRRYVALKVLAPHLSSDAEFLKRFRQEAVSAANLKHTSIVTIHDVGVEDGQHYIAMEYIEGESLSERIRSGQVIAPDKVVDIVSQIGSALDYAHQQGFIHRDIKPANVLIEPSGRAVLTDFGIAKAVSGRGITGPLTQAGSIFGTPHYMSPEQVREEKLDHRSDLYSLGIVCYEMLTGEVPFDGTTTHSILYAQANSPPPPLRDANPAVSPPVEAVVGKMLAKDRERRYESAGAFAMALARAVEGVWPEGIGEATLVGGRASTGTELMDTVIGPGVEQNATVLTRRPPVVAPVRRRRWPRVLGVLLLLLVVVGGAVAGWLVLGKGGESDLELAQAALASGNYTDAVDLFEKVLTGEPGDAEALDGLLEVANGLAETDEYTRAISAYERVLEEDADNIEALRGIGEVYESQEDWRQAADWYERLTQVVPDDAEARSRLGWAFLKLEQYESAVAQFSGVTGVRADSADVFEGLGKSYYLMGNFEQAVEPLEKWAELEPTNSKAYELLSNCFLNLSNYEQAIAPLETLVRLNPTEQVYKRLGWVYFDLGRYVDAITQFSEALKLNESAGAYQGLGNSHYKLKQYEDAADAASQWIALEPDGVNAYRLLGLSRYNQGEYEMAINAFQNFLQLEEQPEGYRYLGLSYSILENYQEAARAFEKWVDLSPEEGKAYVQLGWAYYNLERYSDAIPPFQRAIELESEIASAYSGLGASYSALGDHQNALVAYERWAEVDTENAKAFRTAGWEYLTLKKYKEAILAFTRSIQLQEQAEAYHGLAEAHRRQGDCEQAIPYYEKALELRPNYTAAEEGLDTCR